MRKTILTISQLLLFLSIVPIPAHSADATLYERLGGGDAIKAVVSQFVDNNNADEMIAHRWKSSNVPELKEKLASLVCQETDGPCVYSGPAMDVTHAGLKITEEEFDRVAGNLANALDKFEVPEKEKGELLALVGSLKDKVVGQ